MLLCVTVALSAEKLPAATPLRPVSDQASVLPEGAFKRIGEPHWGHNGRTQLVAWRPDSNELASVGRDGYVRVWDVASRKELLNARFEGSARVLRYTADGEQLVLVVDGHPPRVIRWNADTGEIVAEKPLPELIGTRWKYFLVGSPQLQRLGMMCGSLVQVHDLETGDLLYELDMATLPNANRSSDGMVYARPMVFSPDGETLYVPVTDGFLRILPGEQRQLPQLKIGPLPQELRGYLSPSDLDVSPDGERLAACRDGWTMVYNLTENNPIQWLIDRFGCHDLTRFSPDSEMLIGGGHSGSVMLWEVPSGDMQVGYPLGHESLWDVAVSSNDERMALARSQNAIRLIDLASGEEETAELTPVFRRGLMFSSDGKTLVTAGERNRLFYWNVETCEELGHLTLPNEARHYLSFFSSDA
ncbi:Vegetative incompatibility protein HET-E-1, partial [Durusdinium trenchii]